MRKVFCFGQGMFVVLRMWLSFVIVNGGNVFGKFVVVCVVKIRFGILFSCVVLFGVL